MGIRLENNVVIGRNKNFDLMKNIPIDAEEIEEIMNDNKKIGSKQIAVGN